MISNVELPSEDVFNRYFLSENANFSNIYRKLGFVEVMRCIEAIGKGISVSTDYLGIRNKKLLNVELKVESSRLWYQINIGQKVDIAICHRKNEEFDGIEIIEISSLPKNDFCHCLSCQQLMSCKGSRRYLREIKEEENRKEDSQIAILKSLGLIPPTYSPRRRGRPPKYFQEA